MTQILLFRPEEVIHRWEALRPLLDSAVTNGCGELEVDDIRSLVLSGRMFVFALLEDSEIILALTVEFVVYPKKTVMLVGFGAGRGGVRHFKAIIWPALTEFARKAGASSVQTYCQNPAMARYHERLIGAQRKYFVMETPL